MKGRPRKQPSGMVGTKQPIHPTQERKSASELLALMGATDYERQLCEQAAIETLRFAKWAAKGVGKGVQWRGLSGSDILDVVTCWRRRIGLGSAAIARANELNGGESVGSLRALRQLYTYGARGRKLRRRREAA